MTAPTEPVEAALALVECQFRWWGENQIRFNKSWNVLLPLKIKGERASEAAARILAAEVRSIRAILSDANAVHLNMLRGTIAWTPENLRHVTGDDTVIAELLDEVRRLRAELAEKALR